MKTTRPKTATELEGLFASLVSERAGKGMLQKEASIRIMRLYRTPDVLTRTSSIDPTLRADATKANSLVEQKNARTAIDTEARILLPLVHWTSRFFQFVDPDSYESLYEEPDFSQETREEWQKDAVAATNVIAAQLHEAAQHALLVNQHHAAEAEQQTREQLGTELQLPTSAQELIRCTKSESSRLIFGTAVAEEVDRQRELKRRRKKDEERSPMQESSQEKPKGDRTEGPSSAAAPDPSNRAQIVFLGTVNIRTAIVIQGGISTTDGAETHQRDLRQQPIDQEHCRDH
jgi:FtsZ-interacting cell division protein YlmF